MKLLFAITLLLVLSLTQGFSAGNAGAAVGGGDTFDYHSSNSPNGNCDAASDLCGQEFGAMMNCTSDVCNDDLAWLNGDEG